MNATKPLINALPNGDGIIPGIGIGTPVNRRIIHTTARMRGKLAKIFIRVFFSDFLGFMMN